MLTLVAALTVAVAPVRAADCTHLPKASQPTAIANDNRTPAGTLRDGVMSVRLAIRDASWYPDGPSGCALAVRAFAEEGKTAQIPGPLIRVPSGTEVRVAVRNSLATPLWMRGLQDRASGVVDSIELAPGATREFRFRALAVGAWYYWAGAVGARVPSSGVDGQLVGALVVDSASAPSRRKMEDRVFVMTRWTPGGTMGNRGFQINAFNGRSWPHTERLAYTVGDSVRWHVINASDELHMMHLHGFYYRVEARGDAAHDSALVRTRPPTVVTTATRQGEWMSMVWSPDRAGNWLFHCHFVSHMSADQRLDRMPGARTTTASTTHEHATESMAGLLLGITVRPARATAVARPVERSTRVVHVFADTRPRVFGARPGLGFVVQDGDRAPAPDSIRTPSAPLLLTRGEPTNVVVHNRLGFPIAVHWHGIELESYSDGVGGWSGMGTRVAPMIAPNDTFVARMTPPRAGTFMYHVHNEHGDELASGLYAPLLVLEPGESFDERTQRVFTIATAVVSSGRGEDAPPFINGTASPDTMTMVVGTTYRLRILDISSNEAHVVSLAGPAGLETWRAIARDGWTLASNLALSVPAREITAAGVTRDFGFTPTAAGDYTLTVGTLLETKPTGKMTVVPIRVRAP